MEIKKLYKEKEEEKKNEVKGPKVHTMPLKDFIAEHKKLVKLLREGSREELLTEAKEQEAELEKCLENNEDEEEN